VVGGIVAGALVLLLAFLAFGGSSAPTPPGPTGSQGTPTVGPSGEAPPVGDVAIPGTGPDVYVGGGLTKVPVGQGWTLVARGNLPTDPGGYSESAVITNDQAGVTLGVYLLAGATEPGQAVARADAAVRGWARDGQGPRFGEVTTSPPLPGLAAVAVVRYTYVRGEASEGIVVVAVRPDGLTLMVTVEAAEGSLEASRGTWAPVRDAVVADFGA
jgi:hypothetical protein